MIQSAVPLLSTLMVTWSATYAFPFGPGSCDSGGGVDGPHLSGSPGDSGSISNGAYEVRIGGKLVRHDKAFKVNAEADYSIELKVARGSTAFTSFRGFLLRLGGHNAAPTVDTTQFLTSTSPIAQRLVYCECLSIASLAHTSNQEMVGISGTLNIPMISDSTSLHKFDLEVTVVKEASSTAGTSEWYYSKFTLQLETATPPPSKMPTLPPSESPTPEPSPSPTNKPTPTPTTSPTIEPTGAPTTMPSFTAAPITPIPTTSLFPTLAGPSATPSSNPSFLPTDVASENPSLAPSSVPSTAAPSFTPSTSETTTNRTPAPSIGPSGNPAQLIPPLLSEKTKPSDPSVGFVSGVGSDPPQALSREVILTTTIFLLAFLFMCAVGTVWIVYQKSKRDVLEEDGIPSVIATRPHRHSTSCSMTDTTGTVQSAHPAILIDNMDLLRSSPASTARANRAAAATTPPRKRANTASSDSVSESSPPPKDKPKNGGSSRNLPRTPATAITRRSVSTRMSSC